MTNSSAIVQRLWNYCNVLRDDGLSYGDYVEQLTYLLFLKMADERTQIGRTRALIPDALRLGQPGRAGRRRAGKPTTATSCSELGTGPRPHPHHLPQGAEPDPGPGQAASGWSR